MDYRDLIDTLRHGDPLDIVVQAYEMADAIETLLKERDAAVEEIRGQCDKCKYSDFGAFDFPCFRCSYTVDYWRWRGPREGGDGA